MSVVLGNCTSEEIECTCFVKLETIGIYNRSYQSEFVRYTLSTILQILAGNFGDRVIEF